MSRKSNRGAVELSKFFQKQDKAANKIGIGQSHFSLLLSGKRIPSLEVAAMIEKEWGIPCIYWAEEITIYGKKDMDRK